MTHSRILLSSLACALLLWLGPDAHGNATLLKFSRLIDGTGIALVHREIVVGDGIIVVVGNDLRTLYPDAGILVLDNLVAMPGLIDVHVHMTYGLHGGSCGDAWTQLFASSASDRLLAGIHNAQLTLQAGVTSARDLSAFDGVDYHLAALIDAGVVPGPRLFVSGMGIHPLSLSAATLGQPLDVVSEFSKLANQRVAEGADWVKIFASTGSADDLTGEQIFSYPEIKAATDIAHAAGLRVALHSYGPAAVRDALRAGVDSIEHAVGVTPETLEHWAESGTFYVPTIDHNRYYADHRDEYGYDNNVVDDLHRFVQDNVATLRLAYAAGVRIAMGSDAVMSMFGQNTRELEWFVAAGMTPGQAIQTATLQAAALLGQAHSLGRLKPGYAADIVAVAGDPLANIQVVTRGVKWVMKAGVVVVEHDAPRALDSGISFTGGGHRDRSECQRR